MNDAVACDPVGVVSGMRYAYGYLEEPPSGGINTSC